MVLSACADSQGRLFSRRHSPRAWDGKERGSWYDEPLDVGVRGSPPVGAEFVRRDDGKGQLAEYAEILPALARRADRLATDLPGNARLAATLQCRR